MRDGPLLRFLYMDYKQNLSEKFTPGYDFIIFVLIGDPHRRRMQSYKPSDLARRDRPERSSASEKRASTSARFGTSGCQAGAGITREQA